jgi:hypothetical protein
LDESLYKQILSSITITRDYCKNVLDNINFNEKIIDYYVMLQNDVFIDFTNKINSIRDCNKYWYLDVYKKQKIKDFKKTNLCKDKFCNNCKKVKQASRMQKYIPELQKYKDGLYHFIFTVENVPGSELRDTIDRLFKSFKSFTRYLSGNLKIKGVNFDKWGYKGCVRSLEVTYSMVDNRIMYHPHLHVAMILDPFYDGFNVEKMHIINKFSYSYGVLKRLFTDDELLIQKIWYLLFNNIEVNMTNINNLEDGYSCLVNKFNDYDYAELFKYICKNTDEQGIFMTYDIFKDLYFALHNVHQIQGYGCLYKIKDDTQLDLKVDDIYNDLIDLLQVIENPIQSMETVQDLLKDTEYTIISRKRIFKYLTQLYHKD